MIPLVPNKIKLTHFMCPVACHPCRHPFLQKSLSLGSGFLQAKLAHTHKCYIHKGEGAWKAGTLVWGPPTNASISMPSLFSGSSLLCPLIIGLLRPSIPTQAYRWRTQNFHCSLSQHFPFALHLSWDKATPPSTSAFLCINYNSQNSLLSQKHTIVRNIYVLKCVSPLRTEMVTAK